MSTHPPPQKMLKNVHNSFVHTGPKEKITQVYINKGTDKNITEWSYSGIIVNNKKKKLLL